MNHISPKDFKPLEDRYSIPNGVMSHGSAISEGNGIKAEDSWTLDTNGYCDTT